MNQSELILSRAELIFLLKQMGAAQVAGVDLPELAAGAVNLEGVLAEGKQTLLSRSLISTAGTAVPELLAVMAVLAHCDMALILVRGMKGIGQQLFVFDFLDEQILEHIRPDEKTHRLVWIQNKAALLDRVTQLVPLVAVEAQGRFLFEIKVAAFNQARKLAKMGEAKQALDILIQQDWAPDLAENFLHTLDQLEFTLSLACLKTRNGEVVDASSVAVLASADASWGIWPGDQSDEEPGYSVFPTGITDLYEAITGWLDSRNRARAGH